MQAHHPRIHRPSETSALRIEILIKSAGWKKIMPRPQVLVKSLMRWSLKEAAPHLRSMQSPISVNFYLTSTTDIQRLNFIYCQKNKPTNVLAFAYDTRDCLGDVALGLGVIRKEAKAQKKDICEHALHLMVHGFLHLLGFTHNKTKNAEIMENIEIKTLQRFGIANPYQSR